MALAALERGYEYLAITDHSATHGFGDDVSPDQLRRQIELVREADARIEGITLLAGSEVNILPDGALDYDDELLAELDWVIASVHTAFAIDADAMTARVIAAARHPRVDALGHLTGRLIERRAPYEIDVDAVIAACARGRHADRDQLEPRPPRPERDPRRAPPRPAGVGIVINSDAHSAERLDVLRYGIWTARRAWLGAAADLQHARAGRSSQAKLKQPRMSAGSTCSATTRSTLAALKGSSSGATAAA